MQHLVYYRPLEAVACSKKGGFWRSQGCGDCYAGYDLVGNAKISPLPACEASFACDPVAVPDQLAARNREAVWLPRYRSNGQHLVEEHEASHRGFLELTQGMVYLFAKQPIA